MKRVIVVDTETTGLMEHAWAEVIEVGAVLMDAEHGELAAFSSLIMPSHIPPGAAEALRVNGLTREHLDAAPVISEVRPAFGAWRNAWGGWPLVSWHLPFDEHFWPWPGAWAPATSCLQRRAAEPMARAGLMVPRPNRRRFEVPSMAEACAYFRVQQVGAAHRALDDARTAARLWMALEKRREV
jgi:DNA polymerase III epsilon subunit-like protein